MATQSVIASSTRKQPFETRRKESAGGSSWRIRLWNRCGEQMTAVFLPNPNLAYHIQYIDTPVWNRRERYYHLCENFLGEPLPEKFEVTAHQPILATAQPT